MMIEVAWTAVVFWIMTVFMAFLFGAGAAS
jgi:hypothetical protein